MRERNSRLVVDENGVLCTEVFYVDTGERIALTRTRIWERVGDQMVDVSAAKVAQALPPSSP